MPKIYVIHENEAWVEPLRAAFDEQGLACEEWFLDEGLLDLTAAPPEGVFYNRMSASSHTRGHRYGPELTAGVLAWLKVPRTACHATAGRSRSRSVRSRNTRRSGLTGSARPAPSPRWASATS